MKRTIKSTEIVNDHGPKWLITFECGHTKLIRAGKNTPHIIPGETKMQCKECQHPVKSEFTEAQKCALLAMYRENYNPQKDKMSAYSVRARIEFEFGIVVKGIGALLASLEKRGLLYSENEYWGRIRPMYVYWRLTTDGLEKVKELINEKAN